MHCWVQLLCDYGIDNGTFSDKCIYFTIIYNGVFEYEANDLYQKAKLILLKLLYMI